MEVIEQSNQRFKYQQMQNRGVGAVYDSPHFLLLFICAVCIAFMFTFGLESLSKPSFGGSIITVISAAGALISGFIVWLLLRRWNEDSRFLSIVTFDLQTSELITEAKFSRKQNISKWPLKDICGVKITPHKVSHKKHTYWVILSFKMRLSIPVFEGDTQEECDTVAAKIREFIEDYIVDCPEQNIIKES